MSGILKFKDEIKTKLKIQKIKNCIFPFTLLSISITWWSKNWGKHQILFTGKGNRGVKKQKVNLEVGKQRDGKYQKWECPKKG